MPKLSNLTEHFRAKPRIRAVPLPWFPASLQRPLSNSHGTQTGNWPPPNSEDRMTWAIACRVSTVMRQARAQPDHVEREFLCAILDFVSHTRVRLSNFKFAKASGVRSKFAG